MIAILLSILITVEVALANPVTKERPHGIISGHLEEIAKNDIPGLPLGEEDFKNAESVDDLDHVFEKDPIEQAGLFEGDIDHVDMDDLNVLDRNAMKSKDRKWTDGVIPYVISSEFTTSERAVIANAMKIYQEKTCLRFKGRTTESNYIHIVNGGGCSSYVGMIGGAQYVSLSRSGCVYTGVVIHEFMHAAGFWHEQSRADRDDYVTIVYENIMSGKEFNFEKYSLDYIDHQGAPYDTCSIMHYGAYDFSKNGEMTIIPKKQGECTIGQRSGFSDTDIREINTLYQCSGYPQIGGTATTTTKATTTTTKATTTTTKASTTTATTTTKATTTTTKATTTTTKATTNCDNKNQYCDYWAGNGECSNFPDFMATNCAKACDKCGTNCKDEESSCPYWASQGYCTHSYVAYMSANCKLSCKLC